MAYGDFKDLTRRTASDKVLRDKVFNIAENPKYDRYQRWLASTAYKYFDKKSTGSSVNMHTNNEHLLGNIWGADLADMQLISKFNKGFRFLLFVIDIFSKYTWVVPLEDKKGITITNACQKILKESNRKPNKIWVDKVSTFYNSSFKKWLKDSDI